MEILYHDEYIIVCIKELNIDSEKQLPELLKQEFPGEIYPLHRLDLNVAGVMVYARNKKIAADLSKAIANNEMVKEYVAKIHGKMETREGILEDLLFKDGHKNKVFVVKRYRKGVKKAILEYTTLSENEDTSLVHIRLHTGRSHQIRVQFSSRNHPLVGDHKYGSRSSLKAPMLYSCRITFPYLNQTVSFERYPDWAK